MNHHDHHRHHGVAKGNKEAKTHAHRHDDHANNMRHMMHFNVVDTTNQSKGIENKGLIIPIDNANFSSRMPIIDHSSHMNNSSHKDHMGSSSHMHHMNNSSHTDQMGSSSHMHHMNNSSHTDQMGSSSHMHHMNNSSHIDDMGHSSNVEYMGHMTSHSTFNLFTESVFIVEGIHISTITGIIVAMIFSMVIAVLYETFNILAHAREHTFAKNIRQAQSNRQPALEHGITTLIRLANVFLGYLMMLCVMTMNIWLFLSIILGSGLGHLFIRPIIFRKFDSGFSHVISDNEITVGEIELLSDHVDDDDKNDANVDGFLTEEAKHEVKTERTPLNIDNRNKET